MDRRRREDTKVESRAEARRKSSAPDFLIPNIVWELPFLTQVLEQTTNIFYNQEKQYRKILGDSDVKNCKWKLDNQWNAMQSLGSFCNLHSSVGWS